MHLLIWLLRFAFNAKSFAIPILVFFSFFFLVSFSGRPAESFLANLLRLVIKKVFDQDLTRSDSFSGHIKKYFCKHCSWSCYSGSLWHMTRVMHGKQHSQHPKKHRKQPETQSTFTWDPKWTQTALSYPWYWFYRWSSS